MPSGIEDIPQRAKSYAFFDVDDTLISVKSMFSFQQFWYQRYPDPLAQQRFDRDMSRRHEQDISWEQLNRQYYRHFAGRSVQQVAQCCYDWFVYMERHQERLFHDAVVAKLRGHQQSGHDIVFVSGSFPALLQPVAERLGVQHILAIQMVIADGRYTGEILQPQTIGQGKADAVSAFLSQLKGDAASCYAYGDDISDAPMLASVGYPVVVTGGRGLPEYGKSQGWKLLHPNTEVL